MPPIYDGVPGRIDAAVDYLRKQGVETVVLIAHQPGRDDDDVFPRPTPIASWTDSSRSVYRMEIAGTAADNLATPARASRFRLLDLYGSEDLPEVLAERRTTRRRIAWQPCLHAADRRPGADHFFDGEEPELLENVQAWLNDL